MKDVKVIGYATKNFRRFNVKPDGVFETDTRASSRFDNKLIDEDLGANTNDHDYEYRKGCLKGFQFAMSEKINMNKKTTHNIIDIAKVKATDKVTITVGKGSLEATISDRYEGLDKRSIEIVLKEILGDLHMTEVMLEDDIDEDLGANVNDPDFEYRKGCLKGFQFAMEHIQDILNDASTEIASENKKEREE